MSKRSYYVYILTNANHTVLYTGVTSDLVHRVGRHRLGQGSAFTKAYNASRLVYYESGGDIGSIIAREKQIKAGSRAKKVALVEAANPEWKDLYEELV